MSASIWELAAEDVRGGSDMPLAEALRREGLGCLCPHSVNAYMAALEVAPIGPKRGLFWTCLEVLISAFLPRPKLRVVGVEPPTEDIGSFVVVERKWRSLPLDHWTAASAGLGRHGVPESVLALVQRLRSAVPEAIFYVYCTDLEQPEWYSPAVQDDELLAHPLLGVGLRDEWYWIAAWDNGATLIPARKLA